MNFGFTENKDMAEIYTTEEAQAVLDALAPSESPTFTGNPTVPTAPTSKNDSQIASTEFVKAIFDLMYPIGTIIPIEKDKTAPAYGTWQRYDSNTYIISSGTAGFEIHLYYYLWRRTA